jgi:hypothetical protein
VTVGDALAGGANVVTVGGEGMCGRYAASVGVHGSCSRGSRGSSSSGVIVAFTDHDAAVAVVNAALGGDAKRQQLLQGRYRLLYENQQLRYWEQLEAGIKMAVDQVLAVQGMQRRLHVTVVASESDTARLCS